MDCANERGLIIAPNHPSLIDVVLVASRLPRVTCIMKAEISGTTSFSAAAHDWHDTSATILA